MGNKSISFINIKMSSLHSQRLCGLGGRVGVGGGVGVGVGAAVGFRGSSGGLLICR